MRSKNAIESGYYSYICVRVINFRNLFIHIYLTEIYYFIQYKLLRPLLITFILQKEELC